MKFSFPDRNIEIEVDLISEFICAWYAFYNYFIFNGPVVEILQMNIPSYAKGRLWGRVMLEIRLNSRILGPFRAGV